MSKYNTAIIDASPRSDSDTLAIFTELTPANSKDFVGKRIHRDGSIAAPGAHITWWNARQVGWVTPFEMLAYLKDAQRRNVCIIRGLSDRRKNGERGPKRKVRNPDDPNDLGFHDIPQSWAHFEFDSVMLGAADDFLADPKLVIDQIVSRLIGPDASYVILLTSTCGLKIGADGKWDQKTYDSGRVRFQLYIKTDRPISIGELKVWAIRIGADHQTARIVQPTFVRRPQWLDRPGVDVLAPVGIRETCWLAERECDVVHVPDDLHCETNMRRAEGTDALDGGSEDLDTALRRVGTKGQNTAKGEIFAHLRSAVWHLLQMHPRHLDTDIPTQAQRINATLIGRIMELRDQIQVQLAKGGRHWSEMQKYLQDDTWRYAEWIMLNDRKGEKVRKSRIKRLERQQRDTPTPAAPDALEQCRKLVAEKLKAFEAAAQRFDASNAITRIDPEEHERRTFRDKPPVHQIAAPTGVGKSTAVRASAMRTAIQFIGCEDDKDKTVVIAVPHHALSGEMITAFEKEFPEAQNMAAVWRGMLGDDPEQPGKLMCHRPDDIRKLRDAGVSSSELCSKKRKDGTIEYCPFFEKCGYQKQRQTRARIWIVAHETLVHQKPGVLGDVMRIYIDEHFIDAFMFGIESPNLLPLTAIVAAPDEMTDLKHRQAALYEMIRELPDGAIPLASLPQWGSDICAAAAKMEWWLKEDPEIDPSTQGDALAKALSAVSENNMRVRQRATMWRLLAELLDAGHKRSGRLRVVTKGRQRYLEMKGVRQLAKGWDDVPILITDATAGIGMVKAIWPQAHETLPQQGLPAPHGRIIQVVDAPMSKLSCSPSDRHASAKKDADNDTDNRKRAALAQKLWGTIVALGLKYAGRGQIGVITYKGTEEWIRANCAEMPPWIRMMHFGEVSGRNDFSDVSLLICIGRPLPPAEAVTRHTEAIFGKAIADEEAAYVETSDVIETVPDAQGYSTPIQALKLYRHPNQTCERIRRQICEGAIIQTVGRARAVLRSADNPVTIVVMSDIPVPELGPVEPFVWADIAPTVDQVMFAMHGAMLENRVHAANVAPEIVGSAEALKKSRQREVGDISLRESIPIGECPQPQGLPPPNPETARVDYFQYRLPRAGRTTTNGARLTSTTQPSSAWLEERFGESADFGRYPPMDDRSSVTIASGWLPWRRK